MSHEFINHLSNSITRSFVTKTTEGLVFMEINNKNIIAKNVINN